MIVYQEVQVDSYYNYTLNQVDYTSEIEDLGIKINEGDDDLQTSYGFTRFDTEDEFKNWLKNQRVTRTVNKLQIHHTGSPAYCNFYKSGGGHENELARQQSMKSFHVNTRGMSDIAQHFTIFPNGKIVTGRSLNSNPAGITGWNSGAICVEIYGNFDKGQDTMREEQKRAVIMLYGELCKKFNLTPSTNTIRCHAWFTSGGTYLGDYVAGRSRKTCPGTNFMGIGNSKYAIQNKFIPMVKEYMNGDTALGEPPIAPDPQPAPSQPTQTIGGKYIVRYLQQVLNSDFKAGLVVDGLYGSKTEAVVKAHLLKAGSRGAYVTWLQKALINRGYKISADGIFGTQTKEALIKYQKSRGLSADGIAGSATVKAIIND